MKFIAPLLLVFSLTAAFAHDDDASHDAWYQSLMMPDYPQASCCGVADAYWCDSLHTRGGKNYCTISDDRVIPKRAPRPVGMEIEIPDNKMMDGRKTLGNPTGHSVVFLNSAEVPMVYCYVLGSGI